MRILLLIIGMSLFFLDHFIIPFSPQLQFVLFIAGVILLGIPHGAADLLVATENESGRHTFSAKGFHLRYVGSLALFAFLFWVFPVITNLLFILFAAFHFGETDLIKFRTSNKSGKFFIMGYGILILFVIILPHFGTLMPLFILFKSGLKNESFITYIDTYRYYILIITCIIFTFIIIWYLITNSIERRIFLPFLMEYISLLIILYYLPMILGFTFYFVLWHSLFSLKNIFQYLGKDGIISNGVIAKQISLYSLISFLGFLVFAFTGVLILNHNSLIAYVFLLLAILTAPHMQVMHHMYINLKKLAVAEPFI